MASLVLCVLCMFLLFAEQEDLGKITIGLSIVVLLGSLLLSLREIAISFDALELHLSDIEKIKK